MFLLQAVISFLLICVMTIQSHAASSGFEGYRVSRSVEIKEKNSFGEDVMRTRVVTSKEILGKLVAEAKKLYGKKVYFTRDYTVQNMGKLLMSDRDYAIVGKYIEDELRVNIRIQIDFKKFDNQKDLEHLFVSCEQTVNMHCDKNNKTCEYKEYYDNLKCKRKGYLLEDILSKTGHDIEIDLNNQLFKQVLDKSFKGYLLRLCVFDNYETEGRGNTETQESSQQIVKKIQAVLPHTKSLNCHGTASIGTLYDSLSEE